jgi:hypothetical protein
MSSVGARLAREGNLTNGAKLNIVNPCSGAKTAQKQD